ncbi:MAG: TetR/AcrR family transcriptional regulator [Pseudomonadota bacterium]
MEPQEQESAGRGLSPEKRAQIVAAAVAEFQAAGFQGASMDRIAARAEVSKRTVYKHFANKEALFRAILDRLVDRTVAALDIRFDPDRPLRDQLLALGEAEGRLLTSPDCMGLARVIVTETIRDRALAHEYNCKTEHLTVFQDFMAAAVSAGRLRTNDPDLVADQFLGLIKSRAFWPTMFSGEIVSEQQMREIVEDAVDTILARFAA